jgi:hypothetical protein
MILQSVVTNTLTTRPKRRSRLVSTPWLSTVGGVILAVLILELILRVFVTSWHSQEGRIRTIRQFTEGTATSTFEADGFGTYGNRLTGNPVLPGAPMVMILGDSHVVQEAVSDKYTLGAVVERLARTAGTPVNVRQYGWYDAAAPTYIANGPALLTAYHPKVVVVLMNVTDFGHEALTDGWYWRMRIHPDLSIDLIDVRVPEPTGQLANLKRLAGNSALMLSIFRRATVMFQNTGEPATAGGMRARAAERPLVARASVRGMKAVYGPGLIIAYAPFTSEAKPEDYETELLDACAAEQVHCFSTRAGMVEDMRLHHRILRGFHNTPPGRDHLNRFGLEVVGTAIWKQIAPQVR